MAGRMSSVPALTSVFISVLNCGHQTDNFGQEIITMREAEAANDLLSGLTTGPFRSAKMPDDQTIRNPPGPGRCSRLHSVKPLITSTQHRSRLPSGARPSGTGLPYFLYSRPRAPWQVDVSCGLVGASPQGGWADIFRFRTHLRIHIRHESRSPDR